MGLLDVASSCLVVSQSTSNPALYQAWAHRLVAPVSPDHSTRLPAGKQALAFTEATPMTRNSGPVWRRQILAASSSQEKETTMISIALGYK